MKIQNNASWWSSSTTIMDAGHNDTLKFFGIPLVGGDTSGGLTMQLLGGASAGLVGAAIGAAQAFVSPYDSYYFDELLPFIQYKYDRSTHTMNVINVFEQLSLVWAGGASAAIANPDRGVMKIANFDFIGSYTGCGQILATELHQGTLGMVFKKANPIWAILALLPDTAISVGLTRGGASIGPMIEMAQTGAAAATRYVKSMSWCEAANDNGIQNFKEVA